MGSYFLGTIIQKSDYNDLFSNPPAVPSRFFFYPQLLSTHMTYLFLPLKYLCSPVSPLQYSSFFGKLTKRTVTWQLAGRVRYLKSVSQKQFHELYVM